MSNTFSINTSIPYVNARPHIGHALEFLYADVMARYRRQAGDDVRFVTGVDEHGQKNAETALKRGITPQEHVDELAASFRDVLSTLQISHDHFIRTTDPKHQQTAQDIWRKLQDTGVIEKKSYTGLYCVGCEEFKLEKDLIDGKCPHHHAIPEELHEENYFFLLSQFADRLLELYENQPDFILPAQRLNEMKEMVAAGLEDISISRLTENLSWGIPVPDDDSQVMYVWFEALLNYITAADNRWPVDVIVLGKDINRFHSIILPAVLMAADMDLPKQLAVHGFITVEGKKMSKTIGNVVDPVDLVERYGVDPVRYFLMREIAFDRDGDFSQERFEKVYQSELANGLGNLLSRVTNMAAKYFDGAVEPHVPHIDAQREEYDVAMHTFAFTKAIDVINRLVADANETIDVRKPWEMAKTDTEELRVLLGELLGSLEVIGELLIPFMPDAADTIISSVTASTISKAKPLYPRLDLSHGTD